MKVSLRIVSFSLFILLWPQPASPQKAGKPKKQDPSKVEAKPLNKDLKDLPTELAQDILPADSASETKADLYEKFVLNRLDNADFAYEAGKEYIRTYEPVDGSDDQYVAYLKKWVALYEKLTQERGKFQPDDLDKRIYGPKDVTENPQIIFKPEPIYTEEARIHGVHGTVILRAVFRASGEVTDIKTMTGLSSGLTEKAIEAARQIRFKPAVKDGRLVSQFVKIKYNFNIN
jgi:TonB family protein